MAITKPKDTIDLQTAAAKKMARSLVRLKFTIKADEELNKILPDIDKAVADAANLGIAWQPEVQALVDNLVDAIVESL